MLVVVESGTYAISGIKVRDILVDRAAERQLTIGVAKTLDSIDAGSDATGSWESAPLEWYVANATGTPKLLDLDIQIRAVSGGASLDTGAYTGAATSEP